MLRRAMSPAKLGVQNAMESERVRIRCKRYGRRVQRMYGLSVTGIREQVRRLLQLFRSIHAACLLRVRPQWGSYGKLNVRCEERGRM